MVGIGQPDAMRARGDQHIRPGIADPHPAKAVHGAVEHDPILAIAEIEDDIEIDMSACSFLDSSGVGAIVFLYKRKRARGFVVTLNGLSGQPLKLLRHLGVAGLLTDPRKNAA